MGQSTRLRSLAAKVRNWCVALVVRRTRTRTLPPEASRTRPVRPSGVRTQSPTRNALAMLKPSLRPTCRIETVPADHPIVAAIHVPTYPTERGHDATAGAMGPFESVVRFETGREQSQVGVAPCSIAVNC